MLVILMEFDRLSMDFWSLYDFYFYLWREWKVKLEKTARWDQQDL